MNHLGGLLALVAVSSVAQAQDMDRASFYLVSNSVISTDTLIAERRTRTPTEMSGELVDRVAGGRVTYRATLGSDQLITRLTIRVFRNAADTVGETSTVVLGADSIVVQRGAAAPVHMPGVRGTLVIVNPSIAFIEQMVVRARAMGGVGAQFPIFVVGAPQVVPLTVKFSGADSAVLTYAGATMRVAVTRSGQVIGGTVPAQRLSIMRGPEVAALVAGRRDYSAPRNAPYMSEDVVVHTPAGLALTGTITIPRGRPTGRAPAVVTISGSLPEDRDGASTALKGYRPFRELGDTLGRRGVAVLRLDDRGVNGSDRGPSGATPRDFADDSRAGVAYLRTRPEIDADRIGLVGHGEGGIIALMIASTDPRLRAIVLMAASASTEASHMTTPVLILEGATDRQVPATEADKLAAAFRSAGNGSVTVRAFPATNHLFVADSTGGFDYAKLPSLRVRPEGLGAIVDWLTMQFK